MKTKIILLTVFILMISLDASAQCSMCRAVLETEETQATAEGINDGILYLMAFPYLLMAGLAFFIYKSRKKNRAEKQH